MKNYEQYKDTHFDLLLHAKLKESTSQSIMFSDFSTRALLDIALSIVLRVKLTNFNGVLFF